MPACMYVCIKWLMETNTLGAEHVSISYAQRGSPWLFIHSCFRFRKQQIMNAMSEHNTYKHYESNKDLYKHGTIEDAKCTSSQQNPKDKDSIMKILIK